MSHVDDGTLHAYLDGELTPVEVGRLETHIAACPGCRARLDEERALIDRAARLLGMAVPTGPERAAPPLHQLRRPRPAWSRLRIPLAWAATIVVAVGIGYFAGASSFRVPQNDLAPTESQAVGDVPASAAPAIGEAETRAVVIPASPSDDERRAPAAGPSISSGTVDRLGRAETDQQREAQVANATVPARLRDQRSDVSLRPSAAATPTQLPRDSEPPTTREPAPAASFGQAANSGVISIAPSTTAVHGNRDRNAVRLSTSWPAIEAKPARDLLGAAPAVIPGFAIRSMRRNPGVREVVVEQVIAGAVVSLFERPLVETRGLEEQSIVIDGQMASQESIAAKAARRNERLARFVGNLRVEIAGPLPPDSLSRLLDLVRP